jgi:regulator of replication initiation timing
MVDIGPALLGLKYLRDFTRWVGDMREDADVLTRTNEALRQVGEVQDKLQELREDNLQLIEEKRSLSERLRAMEESARLSASLAFRDGEYYRQTEGGSEEGPFCTRCWDVHRNLVRMHANNMFGSQCPQCTLERYGKK